MLRTDGSYCIYKIQHSWKRGEEWVFSIENEEYFPASNKCWQITGVHGTFSLEEAKTAYGRAVSKLDKNRKFRLVCINIDQTTEILS